jgi:hypothetical protein
MNKQLILAVCAAIFGLSGCVRYSNDNYCSGQSCPEGWIAVEEEVDENDSSSICQTASDSSLCQTDPFVNYTRTAAEYRAYGERTPRDSRISQSGAGNNLSAAIPPSIDNEVIEYEEQLNVETQGTEEPDSNQVAEETTVAETVTATETESGATSDDDNSDEDPVQDWLAEEGQNLKALLTQWSDQSGWRLVWNTNRNYVLSAGAMFRGRFADVSSALIRAFARARPAPIATFYKGNRVLVVETMEDENAYE